MAEEIVKEIFGGNDTQLSCPKMLLKNIQCMYIDICTYIFKLKSNNNVYDKEILLPHHIYPAHINKTTQ